MRPRAATSGLGAISRVLDMIYIYHIYKYIYIYTYQYTYIYMYIRRGTLLKEVCHEKRESNRRGSSWAKVSLFNTDVSTLGALIHGLRNFRVSITVLYSGSGFTSCGFRFVAFEERSRDRSNAKFLICRLQSSHARGQVGRSPECHEHPLCA